MGYLLPVLFVQVLVMGTVLILLPLVTLKRTEAVRTGPHPLRALFYFALLGTGYLFIELAFIISPAMGTKAAGLSRSISSFPYLLVASVSV